MTSNNNDNDNNNNTYFSNIYKSINNYFSGNNKDTTNNNNNDNDKFKKQDSASNNLNNNSSQQQQQQQQQPSPSSTDQDKNNQTIGLISNIKSIIKDDKSVHGNSYNLKPMENYELDQETIKKQSGVDLDNESNSNGSNGSNDSSGSGSSSNSSNGSSGGIFDSVTNSIVNSAHNIIIEQQKEDLATSTSTSTLSTTNPNEPQPTSTIFKNLFKKKQVEIAHKIEEINDVIHDDTIDEDTMINKTIDIVGRRRFYEILFLFGSASIISFALRTLYFGKTIRAIEIPDGNLTTVVIRSNSVFKFKKIILQNQPPIYPGVELNIEDIKASTFIDPHFTEPITTNRDLRRLDDGGYVLWTKGDFEIPRTAVGLKSLMKDRDLFIRFSTNAEVDRLVRLISLFGPSLILAPPSPFKRLLLEYQLIKPSEQDIITRDTTIEPLSIKERDELISYVITNSNEREEIFNIYRKYQHDILQFKLNLKRWIKIKLIKEVL